MTTVENVDADAKSTQYQTPRDQWLAFRKEAGSKSNVSSFDRRRYVLMRWDWKDGYYCVGPFATAELAVAAGPILGGCRADDARKCEAVSVGEE